MTTAVVAFVALLVWRASPFAQYLDHAHQPTSTGSQAWAITVYLAGWLLMIAAMMLPTTLRLVTAFGRVTRSRRRAALLQVELIAGFLAVWLLVGYGFRALDVFVHRGVDAVAWLDARPRLVVAASLALAGGFQFTPLKHRCLRACRTPRAFILRGWTGQHPQLDAVRIGVDYGRSCAACCWALMLVMFGVGATSIPWMLGLGAVMAAERFMPEPIRRPLGIGVGVALLGTAAVMAAAAAV